MNVLNVDCMIDSLQTVFILLERNSVVSRLMSALLQLLVHMLDLPHHLILSFDHVALV